MVDVGVTVQVAAVVPPQVPPVHMYDVAVGLQLDVSVEEPPEVIDAGVAVRVQTGMGVIAAEVVPVTIGLGAEQLLAASHAAT